MQRRSRTLLDFMCVSGGSVPFHNLCKKNKRNIGTRPSPRLRVLPGPPHGAGLGLRGGHAQALPALGSLRAGALVVLAVGVVQVGAEVLAGHGGRGAAGRAERVAAGSVGHQVRQHVLEVLLVEGHALQQVVEQLRRHRGVDARTAGHEHVDLVHALDVAGGEPLAGFLVERVGFCELGRGGGRRVRVSCRDRMESLHRTARRPCRPQHPESRPYRPDQCEF